MADTTVVWQVILLYMVTFTPSGEPAIYDQLDTMGFANGYLAVMTTETARKNQGQDAVPPSGTHRGCMTSLWLGNSEVLPCGLAPAPGAVPSHVGR